MTDKKKTAVRVYYDGECAFCTGTARRFERVLERRNIFLVPLQTPGTAAELGVEPTRLLDEVRALLPDGKVLGGADVSMEVARRIWWAWPLWLISRIPGVMPLLHRAYKWYAPRRYCFAGKCQYDPTQTKHL